MPKQALLNLTDHQRGVVLAALLRDVVGGVIKHAAKACVAQELLVHPATVGRIWRRSRETLARSGVLQSLSHKHHTGRKKKDTRMQLQRLPDAPLSSRSTVHTAAASIGMAATTLHRRMKAGDARVLTSVVCLLLTQANRDHHLQFCRSRIDFCSMQFMDIYDQYMSMKRTFSSRRCE